MENPSLFLAFLLILERIISIYLNLAFLLKLVSESYFDQSITGWKWRCPPWKPWRDGELDFRSKESIQNKCWERDFLNQVKRVIKNFDIIAVKLFFTIFIPYLRNTVPQIFKMNVTQLKKLFSSLGFFNYHRVIQKFLYLWPFVLTRA